MGRLQTGRLENFIRRWGSIKGGGSVLSETLGDVFPVLDLENLTPESRLVAGISMVAISGSVTGGVAQLGGLQFKNLNNSGAILVLTKFSVKTVAVQAIACGIAASAFSNVISVRNLDSRERREFNGAASLGASTNTTAPLGHFVIDTRATIDRELELPQGIAVLAPGDSFQLTASITNTLLRAAFFGYLRQAEPSELSF